MKEEIELFLFILSTLHITVFVINLSGRLFQDNPEPMKISKLDGVLIYAAIAYTITYILT